MSKRLKEYAKRVEAEKKYTAGEAFEIIEKAPKCKFDETIDLAIRLGVDAKQAEQMVRGSAQLPHGTGKTLKVAVIAKGEKAREAQEAGADFVGDQELCEKIAGGWFEFDRLVSTPDMMGVVGKLGSVLGPRGLMPNPKTGTVTMDVAKSIKDLKAGKVDFKVDKSGVVHTILGKASFSPKQLKENMQAVMEVVQKAKPSAAKGVYIQKVTVSTTMGLGIQIDPVHFA